MSGGVNEYEDLEDILSEMERDGEWGDVTTEMRRAYARRIRDALRRHDTDLMMKCMQACFSSALEQKSQDKPYNKGKHKESSQ